MIKIQDVPELVKEFFGYDIKPEDITETVALAGNPLCRVRARIGLSKLFELDGRSWDGIFMPMEGQQAKKVREIQAQLSEAQDELEKRKKILSKFK